MKIDLLVFLTSSSSLPLSSLEMADTLGTDDLSQIPSFINLKYLQFGYITYSFFIDISHNKKLSFHLIKFVFIDEFDLYFMKSYIRRAKNFFGIIFLQKINWHLHFFSCNSLIFSQIWGNS